MSSYGYSFFNGLSRYAAMTLSNIFFWFMQPFSFCSIIWSIPSCGFRSSVIYAAASDCVRSSNSTLLVNSSPALKKQVSSSPKHTAIPRNSFVCGVAKRFICPEASIWASFFSSLGMISNAHSNPLILAKISSASFLSVTSLKCSSA